MHQVTSVKYTCLVSFEHWLQIFVAKRNKCAAYSEHRWRRAMLMFTYRRAGNQTMSPCCFRQWEEDFSVNNLCKDAELQLGQRSIIILPIVGQLFSPNYYPGDVYPLVILFTVRVGAFRRQCSVASLTPMLRSLR